MPEQTSTSIYLILLITLFTISHSRAQKLQNHIGLDKSKMQLVTEWAAKQPKVNSSITAKRPEKKKGEKLKKATPAMSWLKKATLASSSKQALVSQRPSSARKSTTADIPTTLFVNYRASGENDGTSWADAYNQLSEALLYAKDHLGVVQEIWVAKGIYHPAYDQNYTDDGPDDNPRDRAFIMLPNISIYGGFDGYETSVSQRALKISESAGYPLVGDGGDFATFLSGDFLNDDYNDGSADENAYHVVLAAGPIGSARLDGFIISGGNGTYDSNGFITVNGEEIPRAAGGGLVAQNSSPFLSNLLISDNEAVKGSALSATGSDFKLANSLIFDNYASGSGTVYMLNSSPTITNATITANFAGIDVGGILFEGENTSAIIRNTIVYANAGTEKHNIAFEDDATASFAYSIVHGSGGSVDWNTEFGTDLEGNIDPPIYIDDPYYIGQVFYDPDNFYFGLHPSSPAINKGNNDYFLEPGLADIITDQRGTSRFTNITIDIGALESLYNILSSEQTPNADGILFVKKGSAGTGSSWTDAVGEVADAIFASNLNPNIRQIWVAGGTYLPFYRPDDLSNANSQSRYNAFLLAKDVQIYGGFAGEESTPDDRDFSIPANASILSGDFLGDDEFNIASIGENLEPDSKSEENAYHLIYVVGSDSEALLDGFTVQGANNLDANPEEMLLINDLDVPTAFGSGIFVLQSDPWFENIVLKNNIGVIGGGMAGLNAAWTVMNSAIYHNVGDAFGSAIFHFGSTYSVRLWNSTVAQNLSLSNGAGILTIFTELDFANNIVYHNTLSDASSEVEGFVLPRDLNPIGSFGLIQTSLIGGSGGSNYWRFLDPDNQSFIFDLGGNLDEDPEFKDMTTADFSLSACSRAIDAGDSEYYEEYPLNKDVAGNDRIFNGVIDLGAFELQSLRSPVLNDLAGNAKESSFQFVSIEPHTFAVAGDVCKTDLLTLMPANLSGEVTAKVWVDAQVNTFGEAVYLQRHFDITPTDDAENATAAVVLYFTQAEFDALNAELDESEYLPTGDPDDEETRKANLRIYQFHGPSSDGTGSPGSYEGSRQIIDPDDENINWKPDRERWEITFYVTGFSGFFAGTVTQNPLPVRLVSFEGKRTENQETKLEWKVVEQEDIDLYQVEYSNNGKAFTKIGQIAANTLASTDYTFTDSFSHSGDRAYYRLKIIELDGKTAYSKIIAVKLPAMDGLIAYPVPAKNELWIDWKKTDAAMVEFIDSNGRVLQTVKKLSASQKIDISGLPAGVFFLKAKGNGVLKVVKE